MKKIVEKMVKLVRKHPEIVNIPVVLILWKLSMYVLRWLDPTSGVYDAGVFQILIFAVIQFFVFVSIAWLAMKFIYGTLRKYLQFDFKEDFKNLDTWQKMKLSYGVFFGLVFLLAYLSRTLMTK